jgi:ATP-dependent metalloprotease FtsH
MKVARIWGYRNMLWRLLSQATRLSPRQLRWRISVLAAQDRPKGFDKFWRSADGASAKRGSEETTSTDSKDPPKERQEKKRDDEDRNEDRNEDKEEKRDNRFRQFNSWGDRPPGSFWQFGLIDVVLLLILLTLLFPPRRSPKPWLTEQAALDLVKSKRVSKATMKKSPWDPNNAVITLLGPAGDTLGIVRVQNIDAFLKQFHQVQTDAGVEAGSIVHPEISAVPSSIPVWPFVCLILGLWFIARRRNPNRGMLRNMMGPPTNMGMKNNNGTRPSSRWDIFGQFSRFGNSRATEYGKDNKIAVSFKDVAGMDGCKEELQEVVDFLKNPKKYNRLGAKTPKGVLLCGPPGTGKTLLAKACAGESGVAFFSSSGSEFVEMFVGVGAARVRDLFARAKAKSPAVIFLDELDAIGKHRAKIGFNDERESTLNQLFVEMDGFGTDANVIVIAATNRKDSIDKALLRPGRFDRIIDVNLPTRSEREAICNVHLRKLVCSKETSKPEIAAKLASLSMGMSGADIANLCNEAALIAARRNLEGIDAKSFYDAYDRVLTGLRRKLPLTVAQQKTLAYHEAGHTVVGWYLKHAQPVLKVPILLLWLP